MVPDHSPSLSSASAPGRKTSYQNASSYASRLRCRKRAVRRVAGTAAPVGSRSFIRRTALCAEGSDQQLEGPNHTIKAFVIHNGTPRARPPWGARTRRTVQPLCCFDTSSLIERLPPRDGGRRPVAFAKAYWPPLISTISASPPRRRRRRRHTPTSCPNRPASFSPPPNRLRILCNAGG